MAEDAPRPIREVIPEVPDWLCAVVAKLHAKDPAGRYQSARELADVLADCEAQLAAHGRLRDFSRIPRGEPVAGKLGRWKRVAAAAVVLTVGVLTATGSHRWGAGVREQTRVVAPEATGPPPPLAVAPFDAVQAQAHQKAWADYLGVPVVHTNELGMTFRLIPPGEFLMGATDAEAEANLGRGASSVVRLATPAHRVRLTRPFYLAEREVRLRDFLDVVKREPADEPRNEHNQLDGPILARSTWLDCVEFCNRLSGRDGLAPAYRVTGRTVAADLGATGYRLPTEAEWEFACRAGTTSLWYFGMTAEEVDAMFTRNTFDAKIRLRKGSAGANPFGLVGLYAGSSEWCWDWYDSGYYQACADRGVAIDPRGPDAGEMRVTRGGTQFAGDGGDTGQINSAARDPQDPEKPEGVNGFGRVLLPVPEKSRPGPAR